MKILRKYSELTPAGRPAEAKNGKEPAEARADIAEIRTEQAEARAENAETRAEQAKTRTELAESRAENAEIRTEQAKSRTESAETRAETAETRTEQAKARTELAEARAEIAESRTEEAKSRTQSAEARTETAEIRTEQADATLKIVIQIKADAPPAISHEIVTDVSPDEIADQKNLLTQLTGRQREILGLIAKGETTKQIGDMLKLSPKTVEYHRMKLMNCLNVHDVPGLVRFALRAGLVPADS